MRACASAVWLAPDPRSSCGRSADSTRAARRRGGPPGRRGAGWRRRCRSSSRPPRARPRGPGRGRGTRRCARRCARAAAAGPRRRRGRPRRPGARCATRGSGRGCRRPSRTRASTRTVAKAVEGFTPPWCACERVAACRGDRNSAVHRRDPRHLRRGHPRGPPRDPLPGDEPGAPRRDDARRGQHAGRGVPARRSELRPGRDAGLRRRLPARVARRARARHGTSTPPTTARPLGPGDGASRRRSRWAARSAATRSSSPTRRAAVVHGPHHELTCGPRRGPDGLRSHEGRVAARPRRDRPHEQQQPDRERPPAGGRR